MNLMAFILATEVYPGMRLRYGYGPDVFAIRTLGIESLIKKVNSALLESAKGSVSSKE